jgi:CRISPR-associated endonuclease/helicase Cas3
MEPTTVSLSEELWSHPGIPYSRHVGNIAATFADDKRHRICAECHDLGKLTEEFQKFIRSLKRKDSTPHAFEGAFLYWALHVAKKGFSASSFAIFWSILRHHGNLDDVDEVALHVLSNEDLLLEKRQNHQCRLSCILGKIEIAPNLPELEDFCDFFDSLEGTFVRDNALARFENYFIIKDQFSRLIFADKHEACFKQPFVPDDSPSIEPYLRRLLEITGGKKNLLSQVRNAASAEVVENWRREVKKKIFIIEAPTGIGKTFMSLRLGLEIMAATDARKLITALPMTSIIDQTFEAYRHVLGEDQLLKHHYLSSPKQRQYDNGNEDENLRARKDEFLHQSWAADTFIVTTFNQLLSAFYSHKNRDLVKFWCLRDAIVILDEVQAIPRDLLRDVTAAISYFAANLNTRFILMSATVPNIKALFPSEHMAELLSTSYFTKPFNNRYTLSYDSKIDDEQSLVKSILKQQSRNRSVLCVVNTKKTARSLYELLKKSTGPKHIFLLSTLFTPFHRKHILRRIKEKLTLGMPVLLVSTQVIEAGVDLDFDCGYREFAPLYSIIQTAGRINRENRVDAKDPFLIVTKQLSKATPYHQTDLISDEFEQLLKEPVPEKQLLPLLKKYFQVCLQRTSPEPILEKHMINLEFETTAKEFDKHFMPKIPSLASVFIEVRPGLANLFIDRHRTLIEKLKGASLEEALFLKSRLKHLGRRMGQYTINVPAKEAGIHGPVYENSEISLCPYDSACAGTYSKTKGWAGQPDQLMF